MLVGRDPERRAVDALIAGARIGQSGVLVLVGEAGIGKTALLEHAVATAQGMRVLRAVGNEAERDVPFGALGQLLRPTESDLARLPEPQAGALAVALALRAGRGADRFAVGAATLSLLTRYSEDRPLGLFIDDAHLLDTPSGDAIAFAVRRLLADPIVVVATARSDEPGALISPDLPQRQVGGLDLADVRRLVADRIPGATAPELAARLHQVTGGNPLAILELGARPERLLSQAPGAPGPVPATVADLYARRITALPADSRTAVLLAAIAAGELSVVHRAATTLGIDLATALAPAEDRGLIRVEADRIRFGHPLIRAAVYAVAAPGERRRMHALIADALPQSDLDRRAWHRCDATIGPDEEIAAEIEAVGVRSADRGVHSVAATALERSARLSPADADRRRRFLAAGQAAWSAGDGRLARSMLEESLVLARTRNDRARALGLRGEIEARCGSPAEALRTLWAAVDEVSGTEPDQTLVLLAQTVSACFYLGDAASALAAAERADALLTQRPGTTAAALGTMAAGVARVLAGRPGMHQIRRAVAIMADTEAWPSDVLHSSWLVVGPLFLRESSTGRKLVREAVDGLRARAALGGLPRLLFHIARDGATTEHWARAEADYTEGIGLARELGQTTDLATGLAGLAWLEARLGRSAAAVAHAEEALELSVEKGIHLGAAWARFAVADLELGHRRPAAAAKRYADLESWLGQIGVLDVDLSPAPELAESLLLLGRADEARAVATGYSARAEAKGQPWAKARAARAAALLAPENELDVSFCTALELHDRTLDAFETARTRLAYGSRLRRARQRVAARPQLRAALRTFESLGARPWADAAAGELRATGESATVGGTTGLDELTPRERQIAVLIVEGRTTREAAAALFLSPKTVEYHLRHVYTKFAITSRAELAERLSNLTGVSGKRPGGERGG